MTVHELSEEQMRELKCNYMTELVNEGTFAEVMGVDYNEPSIGDLISANEIIPDDVIFENYGGIRFTEDDFFCTANLGII